LLLAQTRQRASRSFATDPFKGGFCVLITGQDGFQRIVVFKIDDARVVIAERVLETLDEYWVLRAVRNRGWEQTILRLRYCCLKECLCGSSGKIFATAFGPC
jgi:hypothetical protein